jgi:hypothetical protein
VVAFIDLNVLRSRALPVDLRALLEAHMTGT